MGTVPTSNLLSTRTSLTCAMRAAARRVGGARVARPASRGRAQVCRTSKFETGNPFADELRETAKYISTRGKGILASDESNATTGKRLATVDVENTEDNRRAWRQCLYTAPGLGQYISGAPLHPHAVCCACCSHLPHASGPQRAQRGRGGRRLVGCPERDEKVASWGAAATTAKSGAPRKGPHAAVAARSRVQVGCGGPPRGRDGGCGSMRSARGAECAVATCVGAAATPRWEGSAASPPACSVTAARYTRRNSLAPSRGLRGAFA